MKYIGTRDKSFEVTASQAIIKGICPDGGLFVPEEMPVLGKSIEEFKGLSYKELAFEILKAFLDDFTDEEISYAVNGAYDEKFDTPEIAPLVKKDGVYFLELFHGKTIAFKDMALSILPYLMKISAKKNGLTDKEIVILTATSGDTGKAALEGFADVEGTSIIVFFPESGVSRIQKLQMVTQEGKNTCVAGILGNFDDAQTAVKHIFTDEALCNELEKKGFVFSSANSINIGRLVPQVVYYVHSYVKLLERNEIKPGEKINFVVPTGNFGNILAGYYAKLIGLPVNKLICASNDNKVLYDFFKTGVYNKNREFMVTISPSMDILVSSNLERLICAKVGQTETAKLMSELSSRGEYEVKAEFTDFVPEFATEDETRKGIKELFEKAGYVMDTHTAVAYEGYKKYLAETGDETKTVIVSTASPYKFTKDVLKAIDNKYADIDDFEAMKVLESISGVKIPAPIKDIDKKEIRHKNVCPKDGLKDFVKNHLA
ncbi:MAG: threonine synthase [Firmicutes bacterium]|nr:threonine synthase [Bacillota bacterium]